MLVRYNGEHHQCVALELFGVDVRPGDFIDCDHFGVSCVTQEPEVRGRIVELEDHLQRRHLYNIRWMVPIYRPIGDDEELLCDD